jgi:hypothetical protein
MQMSGSNSFAARLPQFNSIFAREASNLQRSIHGHHGPRWQPLGSRRLAKTHLCAATSSDSRPATWDTELDSKFWDAFPQPLFRP